jgi:hypothetical protein
MNPVFLFVGVECVLPGEIKQGRIDLTKIPRVLNIVLDRIDRRLWRDGSDIRYDLIEQCLGARPKPDAWHAPCSIVGIDIQPSPSHLKRIWKPSTATITMCSVSTISEKTSGLPEKALYPRRRDSLASFRDRWGHAPTSCAEKVTKTLFVPVVMAQASLVEIVHTLKQVVCVKG